MTAPAALWLSGGCALASLASVPLLLRAIARQDRIQARLWQVRQHGRRDRDAPPPPGGSILVNLLGMVGGAAMRSGIISDKTRTELSETLANTRLPGARGLSVFVGLKLLLVLGIPAVVILVGGQADIATGTLCSLAAMTGIIGLLAPDYVLRSVRRGYLKQVEAGLADALDLMVICAEAGLGLEPALERVSAEIAVAHPAVAQELVRTSQDLRLIADRRAALTAMGTRTGLQSMERLALTLVQSMQLGTPLTRALRTIAAELRQETLTRFEARAARLPVLLTVPMIVFILPCVFIVVAGPAGLQVMRTMQQ